MDSRWTHGADEWEACSCPLSPARQARASRGVQDLILYLRGEKRWCARYLSREIGTYKIQRGEQIQAPDAFEAKAWNQSTWKPRSSATWSRAPAVTCLSPPINKQRRSGGRIGETNLSVPLPK